MTERKHDEQSEPVKHAAPKGKNAGMTIKLVKKSKGMRAAPTKTAAVGDPIPSYLLQDNQDGSFTVHGVDAAGATVDISVVASLDPPPTSSDLAVLTVDAPHGMMVVCHAHNPGHSDVTVTATWNDPATGIGPYVITVPCDVGSGPATGLFVTFGEPTIR